ncbi:MAG TPA: DUF3604 domain-containing protein [Amaricoccus sp.]|uniref:DUF3604 domain-containing protein n=2 Tax=Amaricoccus sp. TaxID=1872485 RepID=UPI002B8B3770|nr:DUF3604 domain-containing protein [Amaricoccus sp.]HMR53785.1 DUF3604 domain-containing protein [Amaricoccus sp.]HMR61212.1 DUF3604 domain-containing protein [Amaricoccus sp.]HMU01581.1 DUF3604 domain-containing protein [Amaricoccus sp.]
MRIRPFCTALCIAALPGPASAQFIPAESSLSGLYPGKAYSPYAERSFPDRVFWGDTHLHTGLSVDAGLFGARLGLDDAYRFARGEQVTASSGQPAKLGRPLDWLVIADHSDAMGFFNDLAAGKPEILKFEQARSWYEGIQAGGEAAAAAALNLITTFAQGNIDPGMLAEYSPGGKTFATVWEHVVETADRYNDPGNFSTIIGFEWTSLVAGNNLHRNVLFREGAEKAGQVVPFTTQGPVGSTDPLDLYEWLENYEATTGGSALAIAHNGNLSNGLMFPVDAQYTGRAIDAAYVESRAKWEPLYETTQIKGDGEAHPFLSPDDAFADYETWDVGNLDLTQAKTPEMLQYEYTREALKNGLLLESRLGTNPYKFGLVGSTDSHTALSAVEEDNFFGKASNAEPKPERMQHPFTETEVGVFEGYQLVASGYTGVWATENTRAAIWDALARKEVYATTGPRMLVRFFGGWDYTDQDLNSRQPAFRGYEKGVPMGADLPAGSGDGVPTFMVYALRDPIGANLDRIQIVKGWLDAEGATHEQVYDVAWSEGREPDAEGVLPPVGSTVDVAAANWTNTIGAAELAAVWADPAFDPGQKAFYYARVLEIPTPRWVVYDAFRFGVPIPEGAETEAQERAYTSPIWYSPEG